MSKYKVGTIVTGSVTGIEKYGVFISLDDYYNGLIHISEISDGFVQNVGDYVKVGETIKAKVIDIDDDAYQIKLSIKNINYKINKKRDNIIKEVGTGFGILKDNLNNWIEAKKK